MLRNLGNADTHLKWSAWRAWKLHVHAAAPPASDFVADQLALQASSNHCKLPHTQRLVVGNAAEVVLSAHFFEKKGKLRHPRLHISKEPAAAALILACGK